MVARCARWIGAVSTPARAASSLTVATNASPRGSWPPLRYAVHGIASPVDQDAGRRWAMRDDAFGAHAQGAVSRFLVRRYPPERIWPGSQTPGTPRPAAPAGPEHCLLEKLPDRHSRLLTDSASTARVAYITRSWIASYVHGMYKLISCQGLRPIDSRGAIARWAYAAAARRSHRRERSVIALGVRRCPASASTTSSPSCTPATSSFRSCSSPATRAGRSASRRGGGSHPSGASTVSST